MNMNESALLWAHPEYLWLLVLVPLIPLAYGIRESLRRKRLRRFGDEALVRELMPSYNPAVGWVRVVVFSLALGLFIVGTARPRTGSKYAERTLSGSHIVVALDVSNSMLAQDYSPNRLERAKYAIRQLTRGLGSAGSKHRQDRIGLVVFAGDAYVQLPVTADYASADLFLDGISTQSVAIQGTDIAKALTLSSRCLMDGSEAGKAIVLISDGESHEADPVPVAQSIHENGINIYTVGVGDTRGTPIIIDGTAMKDEDDKIVTTRLDEKVLSDIAAAGGGAYVHATDRDFGLDAVVSSLRDLETASYNALVFEDYEEHYVYFYWAALALLVLEMLPGERRPKRRLFK